MSVLITGGSGYLARGLIARLLLNGEHRICLYSRGEFAQQQVREAFNDDRRLRFFIGDVRDLERLERAMLGCRDVIHAAALKRIEVGAYNPEEAIKTNVLGTMNLIEAARRTGVEKAVLVSSDKAYQPVSPYGLTKALAEHLFLTANDYAMGPHYAVCRYGNVMGSTGSVVPVWRRCLAEGLPPSMSDPEATRFWMTLDQAVTVVLDTLNSSREIVIPEGLRAFRLGDLAEAMNIKPLIVGLPPHEKLHESLADGYSSNQVARMTVEEVKEELAKI